MLLLLQIQYAPWWRYQCTTVSDWCGHQGIVQFKGMKWQTVYEGKPVPPYTLVQNQFFVLPIVNYNTGHVNQMPPGQTASQTSKSYLN